MNFDLSKIKVWKIELYGENIILVTNSGIVTKIIPSCDWLDLSVILGWNVYSAFRFLIDEYEIECFYKKGKNGYVRVSIIKLIIIINEPLLDN